MCVYIIFPQRPFSIDRHMTNEEIVSNIRHTRPSASVRWDHQTCDLLKMLLHPDDSKRLQSVESMRKHRFFKDIDWDQVECKETTPVYIPAQNRIHCDPTHELEEMIVEPNPLHKKHHRLSRRAFKVEDETLMEELERMERRFSVYNRMRLKDAQRPTSEIADGELQDSATDGESRESLDQKLEVDAVVVPQKKSESRSSDGVTRGSPAPGKEASTPPQQKDEGGEKVTGERKEEEEEEREINSVPTDAAGDGGDRESDRKLIASGGEKEGGGGGGEEESGTVAGVTSEQDMTVAPTPRDTTTATIEIESTRDTHKGAEGSEREPVIVMPNNPAAPSEDAPVISGSSSVEMGSPAHSDDGAHDDNVSPTQTDSPNLNPVERTDSMSSGALLLPREQ
ncbi:Serine/threonine-protein kinase 32A [Geodia barretti]|uniref:Serine/threonine-protein kinase 32A n=1 Tax=Geodia barretti TaxID=519541 RepID=A0AA35WDJ2_GEOBA|nr:Serine/threonine-protein kinase 32A [Geodia barretti]